MSIATAQARNAWAFYDWANSAFATVMLTAIFPVYFVSRVPAEGFHLHLAGLSRTLPASALWGYTVSASMLVVALLAPWLGARADFGNRRKRWWVALAGVGALATAGIGLLPEASLPLLMLLFILGNLGFAGGNLFYNALLPHLAPPEEVDRLSSRGYAIGYVGGGLALAFAFGVIQWRSHLGLDGGGAARFTFLLTGLWWALFALPSFFRVPEPRTRPAVTRPPGYWRSFAALRRHPRALLFLLAFLCYNDGIQTFITVSSVFAAEVLELSQGAILGCFLMIQFIAMPGTLMCQRLAQKLGARTTILLTLVLFTGITLYAFVMKTATEFWLLGVLVALGLGGSQALSRSLFARLVPPEQAAEFFGFFAISTKFAALLGPLTFALCADLTGSTRAAVLPLVLFFLLGGALLTRVRMEDAPCS